MLLCDIFPPELIIVGLKSKGKKEVFEEMVDFFCQCRKNNNREEILKDLWDRELKMSTGIQKGIAIPHGKTNSVKEICGILGISGKGIDYDALDGEPVYVVLMLLAPLEDSEEDLRVLKRLAELLDNHEFYSDLLIQKDSRSVHGIMNKYEDIFITSE